MTDKLNEESVLQVDQEAVKKALEASKDDEARVVNIACRRSSHVEGRPGSSNSDEDLKAPVCASKRAKVVSDLMPHVSHTIYNCVDCGYSWSINTGGHFPY